VRLYAGLPRIDFQTRITNQDKFVRYQVLFPTSIRDGRSVHEIPFGASQRPCGIEFPAQNWVDYGDGKHGLTLLNRGLPGNLVTDGTMMLSLLRSTQIVAYGFGGGYEPGMSSDSGFELGKPRVFDYAIVPHQGDWREAESFRRGLEFNNPLLVQKTPSHPGSLPKRWGLLEVSHANVVLSACKPGPQGSTIVRVYEAAGKPTPGVTIRLSAEVTQAQETNLLEDPTGKLDAAGGTLRFDMRPFEIRTLRLELGRPRPLENQ
jgi:alpha-mannosidase